MSDYNSNAKFYATSVGPPFYEGPTARVFGNLQTDQIVIGAAPTGSATDPIPTGGSIVIANGSGAPFFYATSDQAFAQRHGGYTSRVFGDLQVDGSIYGPSGAYSQLGPTGEKGDVGLASTITGPTGQNGAAGAASTITGPTGAPQSLSGYATLAGATFSGTVVAPTINATTALQVAGANISTLYQGKIWACGYVSSGQTGGTTVANNFGVSTATVSYSAGIYTITLGTAASNGIGCIIATVQGVTPAFITTQGSGNSTVRVYTFDKTGTASALPFYFYVIAQA